MLQNNLKQKLSGLKNWYLLARRLLPLFVSALILYFYFERVDWYKLAQAMHNARLSVFIPARLIPLLIFLLIDSYLLKLLLDWFHQPIRLKDVVLARASLYLLALIHIQVSNGGMFLYLMRKAKIRAENLAGLVIFRLAWSVWSINFGLTLALVLGLALGYNFFSPLGLRLIILGISVIWASMFLCLALVYYYRRFKPEIKHRPLWNIFIQARPKQYIIIAGYTLFLAGLGVVNNYLCALSFGLKIPLHELVIQLPIAEIITALPVAFAGLGTTTLAWETLFKPYGSPEAFLSFTIALPVTTYLSRALFGILALPFAYADIQSIIIQNSNSKTEDSREHN